MAHSLITLTLKSSQYENGMKNAKRQWEDFIRSIGLNTKKLSGVALAAGAVTTALKVAKDAFNQSRESVDEWGRTMKSAESIYSGFLTSLNSGDFSGFLSNMGKITESARKAYDAVSDLELLNAYNAPNLYDARTGLTESVADYRSGTGSKESVKAAGEALKKELKKRQEAEEKAYREIVGDQAAQLGIEPGKLLNLLKGTTQDFYDRINENNPRTYSKGTVAPLFGPATVAGAMSGVNFATRQSRAPGTDDEILSYFAANVTPETLQKLQQYSVQAKMTANEIAQTDKMVARMLGGNGGGGGATGGVGGGKVKATNNYVAGSIAAQRQLVAQLTKQWEEAGAEVRDGYKTQLDAAKQTLEEMVNPSGPIMKLWQGDLDDIAGGPGKATAFAGIDLSQKITGLDPENMPKLLSPLQQLNMEIQRTQELMELSPTSDFYQQMKQHLDELIQKQREFTGETDKDAKKVNTSWQGAASAISSVGGALSNIEDPGGKIAALVAQGIASIVSAFGGALGSDTTTKGNIWTFLAAAAASTVQMISMISQIHDATGYAGGGMIEGNSFSGDNQWARVNSGEVILNRAQQGNLASQLQGNASQFELVGAVRAEQIDLVVRNRARRTGRGEYVTTKFQ